MNFAKRYMAVAALVAAVVAGCAAGDTERNYKRVAIAEVQPASGHSHAAYPAQTEAQTSTDLAFMVMGTIERVMVKEGDRVSKGQVVACLDKRDYQTQLAATEAEYNQIKAECERVIAMHGEQAVSDNDYDKARSGLEQITAKLKHHRDQLADCELTAPYDGYVERVYHSAKEAGVPGVPIVTMFAASGTDIVIHLPETEYARRKNITAYTATFSALPGQRFACKLKSMARMANANQLYEARLQLVEPMEGITPGMTAMVEIDYQTGDAGNDNRVLLPLGALWAEGQQSYVYLYNSGTSTVHKTAVVVEGLKSDGTALVSRGLRLGDRVVASGVHALTDGEGVLTLEPSSDLNIGDLK